MVHSRCRLQVVRHCTRTRGQMTNQEIVSPIFPPIHTPSPATDSKGCTETISVTLLQPFQLAIIGISVTDASNGQNNGAINITVNGGAGGYAYGWTGPNGFASSSQDLTNLEAGVYYVTVTDQNGCTALSDEGIIVDIETGVNEILQENLVVFPNPVGHTLNISLQSENTDWQVQILDMTGRQQRLEIGLHCREYCFTRHVRVTGWHLCR